MAMTPQDVVRGASHLVSLPEICVRVNDMTDNPRYSASDIGKAISQDTGLTARLLKLANSPFYSHTGKIDTITRAITVIGARELRDLVLATSAVRTFSNMAETVIDLNTFWRHSITCGVMAQLIAVRCRVLHSERLFVAGLMHDIGQMVMAIRIPEIVRVIQTRRCTTGQPTYIAERDVIQFDHGAVGAELMREWHLPEALQEVAQFHHEPSAAERFPFETAIVHVANAMAERMEPDQVRVGPVDELDPQALNLIGLDEAGLATLIPEARQRVTAAEALLRPQQRAGHR